MDLSLPDPGPRGHRRLGADAGLIPTPGLAFLTRTEAVQAGIMISASHNAACDNGIKIFHGDGAKLPSEDEQELAHLTSEVEFDPVDSARSKPRHELGQVYQEHLANVFSHLDLTGHKVVIDAANGAGSLIAPSILRCFGADTIAIACEPDAETPCAPCRVPIRTGSSVPECS